MKDIGGSLKGNRTDRMVRPSAASLNSLKVGLRQAQTLYSECRSILNYLESGDGIVFLLPLEHSTSGSDRAPINKDADSKLQVILEPEARSRTSIMRAQVT